MKLDCRWLTALFCMATTVICHSAAKEPNEAIPVLRVSGEVYSNVVATGRSRDRLSIQHSKGFATIKIEDLNSELQQQVRAWDPASTAHPKLELTKLIATASDSDPMLSATQSVTGTTLSTREIAGAFAPANAKDSKVVGSSKFSTGLWDRLITMLKRRHDFHYSRRDMVAGATTIFILLALYIFYSRSLGRIHERITGHGSWLVWIPLVRWISLLRALDIAREWLVIPTVLGFCLFFPPPLTNVAAKWFSLSAGALGFAASVVLCSIWSMRLCAALHQPRWLATFIVFPVTKWFVIIYLGFLKEHASTAPEAEAIIDTRCHPECEEALPP